MAKTGMKYSCFCFAYFLTSASAVSAGETLPSIDFDIYADMRLSTVSGEPGWLNNWMGKGRYGGDGWGNSKTLLRLAEVSLLTKAEITWDLHGFANVKYDPEQDKPADLVEAFLTYKPVPKSAFSYEVRAGLMFPHISREHIDIAWTSPYTITPSALNSWIGEEIRALGLEAKAHYRFSDQKLSFTAAIFGFNDPAGSLLAWRGWAMNDIKVGAFSQLPLPPVPVIVQETAFMGHQPQWVHPIREVDNRPGYYVAADWQKGQAAKAGVFYYDNRGNPSVIKHQQYAWDTRFWNFYVESRPTKGLTLLAQYLFGNTRMGKWDGWRWPIDVDYSAGFVLASQKLERHRISARYDWFDTSDNSFVQLDNNNETGHSWTVAYTFEMNEHHKVMLEYLHLDSNRPGRETIFSGRFGAEQRQDIGQLSYRISF